jgi:hypothetical protein
LVYRSLSRDVREFLATQMNTSCVEYGELWRKSFEDGIGIATGNESRCWAPIRVLRCCVWERCKILENVVKAFSVPGNVIYTFAAESVRGRVVDQNLTSLREGQHSRAISLLSEAVKRQRGNIKLLLKRAKQHIILGKLSKALDDLLEAEKILTNQISLRVAAVPSASLHLLADVYCELGTLFIEKNIAVAHTEQRVEASVRACQSFEMGRALHPLVFHTRDCLTAMLTVASNLVKCAEEENVVEGVQEKSTDARHSAAGVQLPPVLAVPLHPAVSAPSTVVSASSSKLVAAFCANSSSLVGDPLAKTEIFPGMECCYEQCSNDCRSIRRNETWTELSCTSGCDSVFHKKCYRAYLRTPRSSICPRCGDAGQLETKPLFLTESTAAHLRQKVQRPTPRSRLRLALGTDVATVADTAAPSAINAYARKKIGGDGHVTSAGRLDKRAGAANTSTSSSETSRATSFKSSSDCSSSCAEGRFSAAVHSKPLSPANNLKKPKSKICNICVNRVGEFMTFNSASQFMAHCSGAKHVANVQREDMNSTIAKSSKSGGERIATTVVQEFFKELEQARDKDELSQQVVTEPGFFGSIGKLSAPAMPKPVMTLKQAVDLVVAKLRVLGGETQLSILSAALNFTTFGVEDAQKYMTAYFGGLRKFCKKQPRHFVFITKGFKVVDPIIGLAVNARAQGSSPSQLLAAAHSAAGASIRCDFPTQDASSSIAPLLTSEGVSPAWARTMPESVAGKHCPPTQVHHKALTLTRAMSARGAAVSCMSMTSLVPAARLPDPDLCCICIEHDADCETDTCRHGYCENCIRHWRTLRKGDSREFKCCYCQGSYASIVPRSKKSLAIL